MSRTFRRKNYEQTRGTSWARRGGKVYGYYTECDFADDLNPNICWNLGNVFYREPTKKEYNKEYYRVHGDNHAGDWTPGKWYRTRRMKQNRAINKNEMARWKKNPDQYEPLFEIKPRDHLWDWD